MLAVEGAGPLSHDPDPEVDGLHEVAGAVERHPVQVLELSAGSRAAIAGVSAGVARDYVDVTGGQLPTVEAARFRGQRPHQGTVEGEQVPGAVNRHRRGCDRLGPGDRQAGADDRVDVSGLHRQAVEATRPLGHDPNPAVPGVADHDVAGAVDRHAIRPAQLGLARWAAVTGEPGHASAGEVVQLPGRHLPPVEPARPLGDHAGSVGTVPGDQQVAGWVDRYLGATAGVEPVGVASQHVVAVIAARSRGHHVNVRRFRVGRAPRG